MKGTESVSRGNQNESRWRNQNVGLRESKWWSRNQNWSRCEEFRIEACLRPDLYPERPEMKQSEEEENQNWSSAKSSWWTFRREAEGQNWGSLDLPVPVTTQDSHDSSITFLSAWRETHRDELNQRYFDFEETETLHTSQSLYSFVWVVCYDHF